MIAKNIFKWYFSVALIVEDMVVNSLIDIIYQTF